MYLELNRLLSLAETLDCWVTIYPSLSDGKPQFVVQVTDENDYIRASAKSTELDRACVACTTVLQESIQKGGFE